MRIKFLPLLNWLFMPKKLYILGAALDVIGLGTPDQPAAPDYAAAAEKTAQGNLDMASYSTDVNRPDMYNPYGTSTWTQGEDVIDQAGYDAALSAYNLEPKTTQTQEQWDSSGMIGPIPTTNSIAPNIADFTTKSNDWTNTVNFSPEQQALYDQQTKNQLLQGQTAGAGLQAASGMFSDPYKTGLDPLGNYDDQRAGLTEAMLARTNTDNARDVQSKESTLIARGIPRGTDAWAREMDVLNRKHTDARQQAEINATNQISTMMGDDRSTRNQTIKEALAERQTPLNEYNSLMTGTQVSNPGFQDFAQQQQLLGPDYSGAASATGAWDLAGWNADVAGQNAITSGLFGLGAAGIAR